MKKTKAKQDGAKKAKTKGDRKGITKKDFKQSREAKKQQEEADKAAEATTELTHTERELLSMQIKHLDEKILRRDAQVERLYRSSQMFKERFEQETIDKSDTVEYLKKSLRERAVDLVDLQERLVGFQHSHLKEKEAWDKQYAALQAEFNDTRDKLTEENMRLVGKLSSLEEFRTQKEDIESKMAALETKLGDQENDHKNQLVEKDKEVTDEKERLHREVLMRVEGLAAEFRRTAADQMSFTIKKTILENVHLSSQVQEEAVRIEELLATNRNLTTQTRDLTTKMEILQESESLMTRKLASMRRIFQLTSESANDQRNKFKEMEEIREKYQLATERTLHLEDQITDLKAQLSTTGLQKNQLEKEVKEYRILLSQMQESAHKLGDFLLSSAKAIQRDMDEDRESSRDTVEVLLRLLIQAEDEKKETTKTGV